MKSQQNSNAVHPELLSKFRCVHCRRHPLALEGRGLACPSCGAEYPIRQGRFPDFLTPEHRRELEKEIDFWTGHFGDTVYEFESDRSYNQWAAHIRSTPEFEVMELGCGSGAQLRRLPGRLRVGLEPVLGLLTATEGFQGVIGTVENLPFVDACFDLVYFNYSLHHVADREKGFAEAVRVTRPNGRLVAVEPNADHPQRRLTSNPKSPFRKLRFLVGFVDPQETFFTAREVQGLAEGHGLRLESLVYRQSHYTRPSPRYRVQQAFAAAARHVLPHKYVFPSFVISFRKQEA